MIIIYNIDSYFLLFYFLVILCNYIKINIELKKMFEK